jgi:hypothetical protein
MATLGFAAARSDALPAHTGFRIEDLGLRIEDLGLRTDEKQDWGTEFGPWQIHFASF